MYAYIGDVASKIMSTLCKDPSCQYRFILTVHWISFGEAVLLDPKRLISSFVSFIQKICNF